MIKITLGMTKAEQEDTLHAFRRGDCKVLVSTSVAEEGLDIKQCNLIVTYNYATNEIGKVQRKGNLCCTLYLACILCFHFLF